MPVTNGPVSLSLRLVYPSFCTYMLLQPSAYLTDFIGELKPAEVVLEDDIESNHHNELADGDSVNDESDQEGYKVAAQVDSYASNAYAGEELGEHELGAAYKSELQNLSEPECNAPEATELHSKERFTEETVEQPRSDGYNMKEADVESPPEVKKEVLTPPSERTSQGSKTLSETNGNEENIRYVRPSKERNGNIQASVTSTPVVRTKIDDNEMPTKGKVSSLKSLFESNAVHNSDTNKHSSYKQGKVSSLKSLFESNAVHNSDTNKHSSYKQGALRCFFA
uniref:Ovule protein n=1 Tax=Ascaris lumbricoides TaxID=6252 RepID=A0A0M3IA49_ASCLU